MSVFDIAMEVLNEHAGSRSSYVCRCGWEPRWSAPGAPETLITQHREHVAAVFAERFGGLSLEVTDEEREIARKAVEDVLIEWRDSRLSVLRHNGLVIAERDGTPSSTIRLGFEDGLRIGLKAIAENRAALALLDGEKQT